MSYVPKSDQLYLLQSEDTRIENPGAGASIAPRASKNKRHLRVALSFPGHVVLVPGLSPVLSLQASGFAGQCQVTRGWQGA